MTTATSGDTVRFHFVGKLDDGTEFDSSADKGPAEVELGQGKLMPALETALTGMESGDKKTVTVAAADAFGPRRDDLIQTLDRNQIPKDIELSPGKQLTAADEAGQTVNLVVTDVTDSTVTVDGNHPLAGHDLTFDLELVEIV